MDALRSAKSGHSRGVASIYVTHCIVAIATCLTALQIYCRPFCHLTKGVNEQIDTKEMIAATVVDQ